MAYRFFPPVIDEHWQSDHPFKKRLYWSVGLTVARDGDGGFETVRSILPEPDWVEGRDYFVGGHHYSTIPDPIGLELIDAGYDPEFISPDPELLEDGYGEGGYGQGGYGT